jgi:hypothetical protein
VPDACGSFPAQISVTHEPHRGALGTLLGVPGRERTQRGSSLRCISFRGMDAPRRDTKKPRLVAGASIGEARSQWAQPPALEGEPSVLNDEPQAQLLTAFGLLMAKPEPMSEST